MLLICCEGKTEKEYLEILRYRIYRIPNYVEIKIIGETGQHKALIDHTVELRKRLSSEQEMEEDDIECWAICDDDGMSISYNELMAYAIGHDVNLVFARPQFESFLIQHFEQSKETNAANIIKRIEEHMQELGFSQEYDKANLDWLEEVLDQKPKLVEVAITNSDQRLKQTSSPFITVQNLVRRLREIRLK